MFERVGQPSNHPERCSTVGRGDKAVQLLGVGVCFVFQLIKSGKKLDAAAVFFDYLTLILGWRANGVANGL